MKKTLAILVLALGCRSKTPLEPAPVHSEPAPVNTHSSWEGVPIDGPVEKGLAWLVSVQGSDGGWGQDGGRDADPRNGVNLESSGNDVANTSLVALALLRAGNRLDRGPHREALAKAVDFILSHVEKAPQDGLEVTPRKGTQIQRKLGPYIDTFLAAVVLSELQGDRVRPALEKVIAKIQKNQQKDGSWNAGGGWAPALSTCFATRGLANARMRGVAVDAETLARADKYQASNYAGDGRFETGSSAGIQLYSMSGAAETASRDPKAPANAAVLNDLPKMLENEDFLRGYGSMGGEEFVSYLTISDSLVRAGGGTWTKWNARIKERLVKLQNQDGTWAGHHCITGRVACTSAAALTLLAERTAPKAE